MSDTGTATLGIMAVRTLRRKAKTTRMTSRIERPKVNCTSCTEARMVSVRSRAIGRLIVGGSSACNCGTMARTRSTVSMILAPGWRQTMSKTAGLPLTSPSLQAADDVAHAALALVEWLQVDLDAPAIDRRIGPIDTDEGRQTLDRRVLQNHLGEGLLAFGHGGERYRLRCLRNAEDNAGILPGAKTLGHDDIEPDRGHEGGHGDHEGGGLVPEHPA